jgi:hypothetical protein
MKKLFAVLATLALLVVGATIGKAQSTLPPNSTVFTFVPYGSAGVNYQIKTQDGQSVESYAPYFSTSWYLGFQTSGFDQSPGFYINLPVDPDPSNGGTALNLEGGDPANYDARVYGYTDSNGNFITTRSDGTTMDGTRAGDAYTLTAHVNFNVGNGYAGVINTHWVLAQGKCYSGGGRYRVPVPCKPGQGLYNVPQPGDGQLTSLYQDPTTQSASAQSWRKSKEERTEKENHERL